MKIAGLISLIACQIFSKSDDQNIQKPTIEISNILNQEIINKDNSFLGTINFKYSYSINSPFTPFNLFNKNTNDNPVYSKEQKHDLIKEEIIRFEERITIIKDTTEKFRQSNFQYSFLPWDSINSKYNNQLDYTTSLINNANAAQENFYKENKQRLSQIEEYSIRKILSEYNTKEAYEKNMIEDLIYRLDLAKDMPKKELDIQEAFSNLAILGNEYNNIPPPCALIFIDIAPDVRSILKAQFDFLDGKNNPLERYKRHWFKQGRPLIHDYMHHYIMSNHTHWPNFDFDMTQKESFKYCKMKFLKREQQRVLFFHGIRRLLRHLYNKQATWHKLSASHKTHLTDDLFVESQLKIKYTNDPTLVEKKINFKFSTDFALSAKVFSFNNFDIYTSLKTGVKHIQENNYQIKDPSITLQCDFTKQFEQNNIINKFLNKFIVGYKFNRGSHGYIKYENILECQLFNNFYIMFNYGENYPLSSTKLNFGHNAPYKPLSLDFMLKSKKCGIHLEKKFENIDCRVKLGVEFKQYEPKLNVWNDKYQLCLENVGNNQPKMSNKKQIQEDSLLGTKDFYCANVLSCNLNISLNI